MNKKGPESMTKSQDGVTVVDHPLVQHKLTLMREKDRSTKSFRQLLNEIGMLLCYEVTRDLPLEEIDIETPLVPMKAKVLEGGTWAAGRRIAREKRGDGGPPLTIISDGTVF